MSNLKKIQYHSLEFKQFIKKYDLVFSPRTTLSKQREHDSIITNQLIKHFDPFTVNFLKKDFDIHQGRATKPQFIGCLKNHLLQWQPQAENRQERLMKYLSIIYDEIDLLDNKIITWEDFSNYLISKASTIGGLVGGSKGAGKAMSSIASAGGSDDIASMSSAMGSVEKIKSFSLTMAVNVPPKDKDKHKRESNKGSGGSSTTNGEGESGDKGSGDKGNKKSSLSGVKDEGKGTTLHKAVFIQELDKIALVEERSDTIQFMNARTGERGCKDLDCGASGGGGGKSGGFNYSQFKKKIIVMSLIYLRLEDYNNLLLIATDDSLIRAWYYNGNQFAPVNPIINDEAHEGDIKILKAKQPQYCMAWDDVHQMLYSGQRDGMINVWNLRQSKPVGFLGTSTDVQSVVANKSAFMKSSMQNHQPTSNTEATPMSISSPNGDNLFGNFQSTILKDNFGHKDIVTELLMLPKLQYLASCSLDKKVILWDTITGEQKRVYTEHTMGVVSMTFNSEHILLFSAGFDHDIYVWNPYIDNPVFKVQAHNAPIVCVFAIDHTPQLISSDADGICKVWDIRTFECVQTINVQENFEQYKFNLSYMLPIWQHKRLLIAGRQLLFFEYDKNQNPSLADDQAPLCCEYIHNTQEFYTPVLDSVKVWNALNGSIKHIFKNDIVSNGAEITAFCMDLNQKRFIIGDSKGQLKVFNCVTGELMKTLQEHHDCEILNLMAVRTKEMSMVVSVGSNSVIQLHEDDSLTGTPAVRRTINIANYEIQTAKVYIFDGQGFHNPNDKSVGLGMKYLIVGLNKGQIKVYELETGRPDASYPAYFDSSDLNEVYALKTKPFFFTTDNHGLLTLWIGPPCLNKYQKCFEMQNIDPDKNEPAAVNCIAYDEKNDILYIGDERGNISAFLFKDIISQVEIRDPTNKSQHYNMHQNHTSINLTNQNDSSSINLNSSRKPHSSSLDEFTYSQYQTAPIMWRTKEHIESIRHLNFLTKIKIWDSSTGQHIDSLRKGNSDESYPINYKEKASAGAKLSFKVTTGTGSAKSGNGNNSKKLIGVDFEALKRRVESNPAIEKIKETIVENEKSTEWKLFLDVDRIQNDQKTYIESVKKQISDAEDQLRNGTNDGGRGFAFKQNQMDIEMLGKVFNIYQQKANEIIQKSQTIQNLAASRFNDQSASMGQANRFLMPSNSQPLLNLKNPNQGMFGNASKSLAQNSININNNNSSALSQYPNQSSFMMSQAMIGGGLGIVGQVKAELNKVEEGIAPRRKRFIEQKESLATQKLLYPSKFRKDPYRNKINQQTQDGHSATKLPSIMKSKVNSSGQMLMGMMGIKEKRIPRNVSEAALRFISALDKVENEL
ncbi:ef hand family protein [Stylonychia lemnae]|uniref:Ef hand family protein n=1 Tax=Stylonychia lemnae TaxID=5949 RepID=A0A077ZZN2_STYLE|nr:ef hand family protein [Stylonychia lemnae]|eukprot:CDW75345.1 ef hand family protein [Stylonychia lemnae]